FKISFMCLYLLFFIDHICPTSSFPSVPERADRWVQYPRIIFFVHKPLISPPGLWPVGGGYPVLQYFFAMGGQYRFWVKLYGVNIKDLVAQGHHLPVFIKGGGFQYFRKCRVHYPGVIAAHFDF